MQTKNYQLKPYICNCKLPTGNCELKMGSTGIDRMEMSM